LSGFARREEAWKIVQREVKPTSSAKRSATSPYSRTIGRFIAHGPSFAQLSEFQAAQ
jgi:hypothetical protein